MMSTCYYTLSVLLHADIRIPYCPRHGRQKERNPYGLRKSHLNQESASSAQVGPRAPRQWAARQAENQSTPRLDGHNTKRWSKDNSDSRPATALLDNYKHPRHWDSQTRSPLLEAPDSRAALCSSGLGQLQLCGFRTQQKSAQV